MDRLTRPHIEADPTAVDFMDMEVKMQDVGAKLLDLILNGPTINSVPKNILRHMVRQLYTELKRYEDLEMNPEQVAAMKQELIDERHRHDRLQDFEVAESQLLANVKTELADMKELWDVLPVHIRAQAIRVRDAMKEQRELAKDTNVPTKEEDHKND